MDLYINKGDIIGLYDVAIKSPVKVKSPINFYFSREGKLEQFSVNSVDSIIYVPVPIYIYLDFDISNVINVRLMSSRRSYIDSVYIDNVVSPSVNADVTSLFEIIDSNKYIVCENSLIEPKLDISNNKDVSYVFESSCSSVINMDTTIVYNNIANFIVNSINVVIAGDSAMDMNNLLFFELYTSSYSCSFMEVAYNFNSSKSYLKKIH